jgi:benzoyl-CoA 2,3-epoxidase subunit B
MRKLSNFNDWVDYFQHWQQELGLDRANMLPFHFETKYGDIEGEQIGFGHYKGRDKWENVMQIPDQRIRDALLHLIVYQGDTEFASVEQQKHLMMAPPSTYDLHSLQRVMNEEMRHGWQMSAVLCEFFGTEGRLEAAKLLERRAEEGQRLLGSFNELVENWLDFFTYTTFVDRDGKYQLRMLTSSGFAPLARSAVAMLQEESYHLATGYNGVLRIIKGGLVPPAVVQKYFNKWIPTAFDLFGKDESSSAHWSYVWGLKGRYDEKDNPNPANLGALNEAARDLYRDECVKLVTLLNRHIADPEQHLYVPHLSFNRSIGTFADANYSVKGEPMEAATYAAYLESVTPNAQDRTFMKAVAQEKDWIAAPPATA